MVLQVWVAPGFDAAAAKVSVLDDNRLEVVAAGSVGHMEMAEDRIGRARMLYKATRRESYETIGRRFGLSARDMARINKKPFDTVLAEGDTCIVYKVVDRSASERAAKQARAVHQPDKRRKQKPPRRRR